MEPAAERSKVGYRIVCVVRRADGNVRAVGYSESDIPELVRGTLPQHRVTKISPRPASEEDLARLFEDAMVAW